MGSGSDEVVIEVVAGRSGLVLAVGGDGRLHQIGFGPDVAGRRPELPVALYPLAYPTFGEEILREPALRITHADGATATRLRFVGVTRQEHRFGETVCVEMAERVAAVTVQLWYRTWTDNDLLEQWVAISNHGSSEIIVHQAASTAPALGGTNPHLTHWGGGWAGEWKPVTEPLRRGTKTVASAGGVRPSLHLPPVVLAEPDGPASEIDGLVGACTLVWGGDSRFDAEVTTHAQQRIVSGVQHVGAERRLGPGEEFVTPAALWTWSDQGRGPTSRTLHRHVRQHVVRDGGRPRAIVANTWEAVFFDLSTDVLIELVERAADLGAELFLLDDGWFGGRYPRDDDTTSLGDWDVNRSKLPEGLAPVIEATLARGMRFGLWVEPEMVNPISGLHQAHPGWAIGEPGREPRTERNQLVLDVLQPDVGAFVSGVVRRAIEDHPGVTYLKWDANRDITEAGSTALPADRQSHLPVDRIRATEAIFSEVVSRHPTIELMACASGGGRSDLATLAFFHEMWTSDDTDPVDRVRLQWGASHLLPAGILGAHVTRWGDRPIAFGAAVALSGRFGFDLDLRTLTAEEAAVLADATATAKATRHLVHGGDLHRLVSPIDNDRGALAYVDPEGSGALAFAFRLPADTADPDEPNGGADQTASAVPLRFVPAGATVQARDLTPGRPPDRAASRWVPLGTPVLDWPAGPAPAASVLELRWS